MSIQALAPTEKHLEDYLWGHPEVFGEYNVDDNNDPAPHFIPKWRQVQIASGRVDIVGSWFDSGLAIVELKRETVDSHSLAQLLRYMRDFRQMIHYLIVDYRHRRQPFHEVLDNLPYTLFDWNETLLHGILIGSSISDENLLVACQACHIEVMTYNYDGDHYTLTEHHQAAQSGAKTFPGWTAATPGAMVSELVRCIHQNLSVQYADQTSFDAVWAANAYLNLLDGGS